MTQEEFDRITVEARERMNTALARQLTRLTPGQARTLLENAQAKVALAQAFGDADLFTAYLREQIQAQ